MDLIYTDKYRRDVGVMKGYSLDLAYGADENDFELTLDLKHHCCEAGCLVYIEGTEYGGIIDKLNVVTEEDKLTYKGRTWHGILGSKIIEPDEGEAHLIVSGEANTVLGMLLERVGLSDLFTASDEDSGLTINNYSFDRYIDVYSGITKMLDVVSGKLNFKFKTDKVIISVLPIVDYSKDEQFDNDNVEMEIEKVHNTVNHLICLGEGELAERQVVHLYMDASGNISETQTIFGLQEYTSVHDYPNAESLEDLIKSGMEKFKEIASEGMVGLNFASEENIYDVGDIIGAKEITTGIFACEKISKKIVTINQKQVNIQYKVGE